MEESKVETVAGELMRTPETPHRQSVQVSQLTKEENGI